MSTAIGSEAVTQQIVGNALASIADEMATTIFRTAHSTVVRDGMDFSAAICDPNGETLDVPVRTRASIGDAPEPGPLLVDEYDTTVVVRPGWTVRRDAATQTLVLERA